MKKKLLAVLVTGSVTLGIAGLASATLYTGEVGSDAYVSFNGYDLAWASPCSDGVLEESCSDIDMTEQAGYGWEIMTSSLFSSLGINADTFLVDYSSANTQSYNGYNYAKATGWFSNQYTHIDVSNGISGLWSFVDVIDGGSYYETIVYRSNNPDPVPEPATMLLFGTGIVGLAGNRIRKKKK